MGACQQHGSGGGQAGTGARVQHGGEASRAGRYACLQHGSKDGRADTGACLQHGGAGGRTGTGTCSQHGSMGGWMGMGVCVSHSMTAIGDRDNNGKQQWGRRQRMATGTVIDHIGEQQGGNDGEQRQGPWRETRLVPVNGDRSCDSKR